MKTLLAALLICCSALASAQALKGVESVNIVVEEPDQDATDCGITKDALDAAVRLPLSNSRLKIKDGLFIPDLFVRVTALKTNNQNCAVSTQIQLYKWIQSEMDFGGFWQNTHLLTGPKSSMGKRVTDKFESFTKQFIAAWLKANPS